MKDVKDLPLAIIIPVRKEEETIIDTLELIKKSVHTKYVVLVVDDMITSSDKTILKKLIHHASGFSFAVWRGIQEAHQGAIVIVMADGCDDLNIIDRMFEKIFSGYDIVCGSRYMKGGKKIGGPKIQGFFSFIVNISLSFLLRLPTKDVSNAFKMYRRDIFNTMPRPTSTGFEISMEIFFNAYFRGAKITETPTTWIGRSKGESKFKLIERAPGYVRIYLWILANAIRQLFHMSVIPLSGNV